MPSPLITTPGIYANVTCEQYFAEPCPTAALTNSGLKTLLGSCPARFAHDHPAIGQPEEDRRSTAAMYLGSLVHRLALGKGSDYAISPFDEYRSKDAKEWKAETEAAGLIPVKPADFERASVMAAAISEGIKQETRGEPFETEVVVAWRRSVNGFSIWCRAMIDVWCPSLNLALDVKTCADASDKAINRAFANGYAQQDAFYSEGLQAVCASSQRPTFGFLFVENAAPFCNRYAECDEAFRHGASLAIDKGANLFAVCMQNQRWPNYGPLKATPPVWWLNEVSDLELEDA